MGDWKRVRAAGADFEVQALQVGTMENVVYLLRDPDTREGYVIDAGWEPDRIAKAADDVQVKAILVTHGHNDHHDELDALKAKLGVPRALASCHTAQVGGYVIEGHVPAGAIKRLLTEKPKGIGLAVPGMPVGSPGMEVEGAEPDTYDVVLFGAAERRTFARYRGGREI